MITIVPYDMSWPEVFIAVARPLRTVLGELALRIDHIGSTSVPGLAAKDVIDVQVTLKDFSCTPQLVAALGSLGYTLVQEVTSDHVPPLSQESAADWEKRYFRYRRCGRKTSYWGAHPVSNALPRCTEGFPNPILDVVCRSPALPNIYR